MVVVWKENLILLSSQYCVQRKGLSLIARILAAVIVRE